MLCLQQDSARNPSELLHCPSIIFGSDKQGKWHSISGGEYEGGLEPALGKS